MLVVEDETELRGAIVRRLRAVGFAVDEAADLPDAWLNAGVTRYDCLVLDRLLPSGDAVDLLRRLRGDADSTPAILLTARDGLADRVEGFESGADDYLVKPFAMDELVARVRSLCRRAGSMTPPIVRIGDLEIDRARREVRRDGVLLPLTAKELSVFEVLTESAGRVVSRSELIERCWDEHADPMSNVVDVHVASLRRKLGRPPVIRTVRGAGFVLESP